MTRWLLPPSGVPRGRAPILSQSTLTESHSIWDTPLFPEEPIVKPVSSESVPVGNVKLSAIVVPSSNIENGTSITWLWRHLAHHSAHRCPWVPLMPSASTIPVPSLSATLVPSLSVAPVPSPSDADTHFLCNAIPYLGKGTVDLSTYKTHGVLHHGTDCPISTPWSSDDDR